MSTKLLADPIWIHALRALANGASSEAIDIRGLAGDASTYIHRLRAEIKELSKKLEKARKDVDK